MPISLATKRAYLLQFAGVLPPEFQGRILELSEFGGLEDLYDDREIDISKALDENEILLKGIYVEVDMIIDNHKIEFFEHTRFYKSKRYKKRLKNVALTFGAQAAMAVHSNFKNHIIYHYQAMMNQAMMMAQQRAALAQNGQQQKQSAQQQSA